MTVPTEPGPGDFTQLREEAERYIAKAAKDKASSPTPQDLRRVVHELDVHRVELQLQNHELRQIEGDLEQSRDRYRELYDFAPVGYVTLDADARISEANLTAATMLGVDRSQLMRRHLSGFLVSSKDGDHFHTFLQQARATGTAEGCYVRMSRADGTAFFSRMQASAADGAADTGRRCLVAWVDVSEERHREARMLRLATVVGDSNDAVTVLDLDGRILAWNRSAEQTYGYSQAEAVGMSLLELVPAEHRPETRRLLQDLAAEVRVRSFETQRCAKDGRVLDIRVTASFLVDGSGDVAAISTTEHDITERKRIDRALAQSEQRLKALVDATEDGIITSDGDGIIQSANVSAERIFGYAEGELISKNVATLFDSPATDLQTPLSGQSATVSASSPFPARGAARGRRQDGTSFPLQVSVAELQTDGRLIAGFVRDLTGQRELEEQLLQAQKMEAVGRLASGIAHDFNNLLTIVIGFTRLSLEKMGPEGPAHAMLESCLNAAKRGSNLARQLMSFGRGKSPDAKAMSVDTLLTRSEDVLQRLLGEDIVLRVRRGCPDATVVAEEGQLDQVLMNLATNARDAMPAGGRIDIETTMVTIEEGPVVGSGPVAPGRYVRIAVRDTGCGMDEQTRARIYEPFFTTKDLGAGTGLGLFTAFGIARRLGGRIDVQSEVGRGTVVTLDLPCCDETEGEPPQPQDLTLPTGLKALVVEDDALVRWTVRQYVEDLGLGVLVASNAEDALQICEQHDGEIDLLITDVTMPGGGGGELAREVCARWGDIAVLFISGYPGDRLVTEGRIDHGAPLLPKPFEKEALAAALQEILEPVTAQFRVTQNPSS
jgi:two-component system cell cycle sensor histidine kinase/response regulator CckA